MCRSVVSGPGLHSGTENDASQSSIRKVLFWLRVKLGPSIWLFTAIFTIVGIIKWKQFSPDTLVSICFVCIFCYRKENVYGEQLPVFKVGGLITVFAFENTYCHGSPLCLGMLVLSDCIYIFLWLLSALISCKQKSRTKDETQANDVFIGHFHKWQRIL